MAVVGYIFGDLARHAANGNWEKYGEGLIPEVIRGSSRSRAPASTSLEIRSNAKETFERIVRL
jgi:hypothetical protein